MGEVLGAPAGAGGTDVVGVVLKVVGGRAPPGGGAKADLAVCKVEGGGVVGAES